MKAVLKLVGTNRTGRRERSDYRGKRNGKGSDRARTARSLGAHSRKPLVSLNAGALAEGVFESELFGHVRGAFTDAQTIASADSNWPMAAHCFWTKSRTCRSICNRNFYVFWRRVNSNALDRQRLGK